MENKTTCGAPMPHYDSRATSTAVASPVQGAASATDQGAAVKPWQERMPDAVRQLGTAASEAPYKDAEIADWRALADRSPAVQPNLTPMQSLGEALKLACPPLNRGEWATFEAAIRKDGEQQTVHAIGFVRGAQATQPSGAAENLRITKLPARYASEQEEQAIQRVNDAARKHIARVSSSTPAPEQEAAQVEPVGYLLEWRGGTRSTLIRILPCKEELEEIGSDMVVTALGPIAAPVEQEAAQVAPPGAQEVHFFRQKDAGQRWCEISAEHLKIVQHGPSADVFEYRTLYTAPVPATTPAEQPEQPSQYGSPELQALIVARATELSVMRPFGAPAGQHDWVSTGERLPEQRERAYQVVAICAKKCGDDTNYPGQGIRGVRQDWVVRRWPQNFVAWMPLPPFSDQSAASGSREAREACPDAGSVGHLSCATATNTNQPEGEKGGAA